VSASPQIGTDAPFNDFSAIFAEFDRTGGAGEGCYRAMNPSSRVHAVACLFLVIASASAFGNSSIASPISQPYQVFLENPQTPNPEIAPDIPSADHDHADPVPTPVPTATPVTTPTPAPGSGNTRFENDTVIVTFKITNDWLSGFQGDVVIENKTATTLKDWNLSFRFDRQIVGPWNARIASKSGDRSTFDAIPYT
jgi:hypothetical protein